MATAVLLQVWKAASAASIASSMSSFLERAACVNTVPVTGDVLSKYSPPTGFTHLPLMKLSYCALIAGQLFLENASVIIDVA